MRQTRIWCLLLAAVAVMAACVKSTDTEVTLYNDAAITAFSLGTLNRYTTSISEDGDTTTTKATLTGSSYKFSIDQMEQWDPAFNMPMRHIYNADSLPAGTDQAHVICSITTQNNGMVIIQDVASDTLRYYSSIDSLDFSSPRRIIVYSSDGTGYNQYAVRVNVHQQEPNAFVWQLADSTWTPATSTTQLPADISQLIGNSTTEQYALSDNNRLMVLHEGDSIWREEQLDDNAALLPTQDLSLVTYPMPLADSTDYVLLVGNRATADYPKECTAVVWRKIVDYSKNAPKARWTYMESTVSDSLKLPRLQNLSIVKYDDGILAIGGAGIGGCTKAPYTQFYQSRDNGITWKYNARYQLPQGFDTTADNVLMTVNDDNFIWMHCSGTGQVWRGRLNRLGWKK